MFFLASFYAPTPLENSLKIATFEIVFEKTMQAKATNNDTVTRFELYLKAHACRKTPERMAIIAEIVRRKQHFDAAKLGQWLAECGCHVSRATLYNNLELLVDSGILRKHVYGQSTEYELLESQSRHIHIICKECGKVKEVRDVETLNYLNTKKYSAFTTDYFVLYVYGTCNACSRKRKRANDAQAKTAKAKAKNQQSK